MTHDLWALFYAAGPERKPDELNPYTPEHGGTNERNRDRETH